MVFSNSEAMKATGLPRSIEPVKNDVFPSPPGFEKTPFPPSTACLVGGVFLSQFHTNGIDFKVFS